MARDWCAGECVDRNAVDGLSDWRKRREREIWLMRQYAGGMVVDQLSEHNDAVNMNDSAMNELVWNAMRIS